MLDPKKIDNEQKDKFKNPCKAQLEITGCAQHKRKENKGLQIFIIRMDASSFQKQ